jgi:hypothetical protein
MRPDKNTSIPITFSVAKANSLRSLTPLDAVEGLPHARAQVVFGLVM